MASPARQFQIVSVTEDARTRDVTGEEILQAYLFGVSAFEPFVYGSATTILAIVVFAAALRPAWAAARVNPVETLRAE